MGKLKVTRLRVGMVQTNCYLAINEETRETVIIDPGDEEMKIRQTLTAQELKPAAIFLTHGHFDHMMAVPQLKQMLDLKVYAHEKEAPILNDSSANLSGGWIGMPLAFDADVYLTDDQIVDIAGFQFKAIHTPGHTIGSVSYYLEEEQVLFSGDTLFRGSFGRTDLETGSLSMIARSIKEKLLVLPPEVKVYPGHDAETDIATERQYNPLAGKR